MAYNPNIVVRDEFDEDDPKTYTTEGIQHMLMGYGASGDYASPYRPFLMAAGFLVAQICDEDDEKHLETASFDDEAMHLMGDMVAILEAWEEQERGYTRSRRIGTLKAIVAAINNQIRGDYDDLTRWETDRFHQRIDQIHEEIR